MRKVKLRDRKNVRLRNRPPKRQVPDRRRQSHGNLAPIVSETVMATAPRKRALTYEEWVADNPPPDLGELVKAYGSFMQIPPSAWAKWDAELRSWQLRYRTRQYD